MPNTQIQGFLITFALSLLLVPLVRIFCLKNNFLDKPEKRKIHKKPVPSLGGIAIWLATISGSSLLFLISSHHSFNIEIFGIFAGASILFVTGLIDDIYDIHPVIKLIIQIFAALVAFILGVRIEILSNPIGSDPISLGIFGMPLTVLWLVGITNAVNFIDGIDGLAGGIIAIMAITLGIVAIHSGQPGSALVASILAGASMGFLVFNFYPAKIFMGDSGSLFSGFVLAGLSVAGVVKSVAVSVLLPVLIFTVPIFDMFFSVIRRVLKGNNPMKPDKEHIHHKLLKSGLSQNRTVAVLYIFCIAGGTIATFMVNEHVTFLVLIIFILIFMASFSSLAKFKRYKELKENRQKKLYLSQ